MNTDFLMPRERLFSLLLSHPQKRVVLLSAGNGYGKTSLLTSFFQKYTMLSRWITLSQPVYTFEKMIHLLQPYEAGKKLWIVIDQIENLRLDEQETNYFVSWIERLPSSVTLVLSGRKILAGLPISRWKMQKLAIIVDQEVLAFTSGETEGLLQNFYGLKLPNYEHHRLLEDIEGWPAGLALLHEVAAKESPEFGAKRFRNQFYSSADLDHYVATEIIGHLSSEMHQFLLYVSLFREIDEQLLKRFRPDWPVHIYIEDIQQTNLFFSTNETNSFRLNELFRNILYKKAELEWGTEKVKDCHHEIAILYRQDYQFFEALSQAFAAGEDELVIEIIMEVAERYEPKEFLRVLDGYIEKISPLVHLSEISLFLFRCIPVELASQLIKPLELIIQRYEYEDSPAYADLCHRLAAIYFYQGDWRRAVQLHEISLALSTKNNDEAMIALNMSMLAMIYRFMGKLDKALFFSRQALAKSEVHRFKHTQMQALWNTAEILIDRGELEKGYRFAEQSINVSEECDKSSVVYPLCTKSRYFRKSGKLKEAYQWANEALKYANKFEIQADMGWANTAVALCYQASGELNKARQRMEKAVELFKGNRHQSCLIERRLITILRELGNVERANYLDDKVENIIRESEYTWLQKKEEVFEKSLLKIRMLGALSIEVEGENIKIRRKACLRILLLLASNNERRWSKDEIIGLLFPEETEEAASNQFYVALSLLRKQLEPKLKKGRDSRFISYDGSHYYFQFEETEIDVIKLKQLICSPYSPEIVNQTINLYQGDLLNEYPYEEWLSENRMVIREQYLKALNSWTKECLDKGDRKEAIEILEAMIAIEPYEESFHIDYIQLLIETGQTGKSRKAADRAVGLMEKELGIDMRSEFNKLFLQKNINYAEA